MAEPPDVVNDDRAATSLEDAYSRLLDGLGRGEGGALLVRGSLSVGDLRRRGATQDAMPVMSIVRGAATESHLQLSGVHQLVGHRLRQAGESDFPILRKALADGDGDSSAAAADVLELLRASTPQPHVVVIENAALLDARSLEILTVIGQRIDTDALGLVFIAPHHAELRGAEGMRSVTLGESPMTGSITDELNELSPAARSALVMLGAWRAFDESDHGAILSVRELESLGDASTSGPRLDAMADAAYTRADSATRRTTHGILSARAGSAGDTTRRVQHATAAAIGFDSELASHAVIVASELREIGRWKDSAVLLERSAHLTHDAAERAGRLVDAGASWRAIGATSHARAMIRASRDLPGSIRTHAEADLLEGSLDFAIGEVDSAFRLFMASAGAIMDLDPDLAMEAFIRAAEVAWWSGRVDRSAEVSAAVETLRSDGGDRADFVLALLRGGNRSLSDDYGKAGVDLRHAMDVAEHLDAPRVAILASQAAFLIGDERAALRFHRRARDEFQTTGDRGEVAAVLDRFASVAAWVGDLDLANGLVADSVVAAAEASAFPSSVRAHIAAMQGKEADCRQQVEEARRIAAHGRFPTASATALWALGRLELGLGRPEVAVERLQEISDPTSDSAHPLTRLFAAPDLIEAAVRCGQHDLARRHYADFSNWAQAEGHWVEVVDARLTALMSTIDGDDPVSDEKYRVAIRLASGCGLPFEEGRVRLLFGEHLRRTRRRALAREHLRLAIELFEDGGAEPWATRAHSELIASAETSRSRDGDAGAILTARERQIAELVAAGASNHDVAGRLFLSRKTVEYHLHQAYQKLGIGSRNELADALRDPSADHRSVGSNAAGS